ncbi:hypothetical protein [Pontibacter harenae]|uniref:hypothetical protein n=1 Tax=Pontibacter harenae TaxID=2894083 RepID=UPI001E3851BC|nr:hypothetical protein [Pontibacter harenae]MCC9168116.1 hypothetical protein [Pontibacter harenae]
MEAIGKESQIIPIGGKKVYTRLQLMQLVAKAAGFKKRIPVVPFGLVEAILPIVKLFSPNTYDKAAFMVAVSKDDCIAPKLGALTLEEHFQLSFEATAVA